MRQHIFTGFPVTLCYVRGGIFTFAIFKGKIEMLMTEDTSIKHKHPNLDKI